MPCRASRTHSAVSGRRTSPRAPAAAGQEPGAEGQHAEDERDLGVTVDHEVHRPRPVEVHAVDLLARGAAGMRARGGGGRARDDRHGAEDREGTDILTTVRSVGVLAASCSLSWPARQTSTTAATRISIESAKWPITQP